MADSQANREAASAAAWVIVFALWTDAVSDHMRAQPVEPPVALGAMDSTPLPMVDRVLPDFPNISVPRDAGALAAQVRALVEFVDPDAVPALCHGGPRTLACAIPSTHTIIVPNPCAYPFDTYARILCHEKAHLAGWEATRAHNEEQ